MTGVDVDAIEIDIDDVDFVFKDDDEDDDKDEDENEVVDCDVDNDGTANGTAAGGTANGTLPADNDTSDTINGIGMSDIDNHTTNNNNGNVNDISSVENNDGDMAVSVSHHTVKASGNSGGSGRQPQLGRQEIDDDDGDDDDDDDDDDDVDADEFNDHFHAPQGLHHRDRSLDMLMMSPPGSHYHHHHGGGGGGGGGGGQGQIGSLSSLSISSPPSSSHSSVDTPGSMISRPVSAHRQQTHPHPLPLAPHHHYQSSFRQCLKGIRVSPQLQKGVQCIRVHASGNKVDQCWLTLSRDKFTLYLSTQPLYNDNENNNENNDANRNKAKRKNGSWFSGMLGFGGGSGSGTSGGGGGGGASNNNDNNTNIDNSTAAAAGGGGGGLARPSPISQRSASEASTPTSATATTTVANNNSGISNGNSNSNSSRKSSATGRNSFFSSSSTTSNVKQSIRAIDIGAITRIQRGYTNRRFEQTLKKTGSSVRNLLADSNKNLNDTTANGDASPFALNPSQCFSLIFRGDWTLDLMMVYSGTNGRPSLSTTVNKSTLARSRSSPTSSSPPYNNNSNGTHNGSLLVPGGESRDEILDGLDLLLETYQRAKRLVVNDVLLLRYVWLEADKDQSNTIKPNEIGGVLDKINYCQLKKSQLSDLYDNFAKVIALDKKQRKLGLTFEQTCTLLHKIKRDSWVVKPVNQYWNIIFGEIMKNGKPRQTVSDKTFLDKFLHNSQGETSATLADVHRLFARLNDMELPYVSGEGIQKDPRRIDKNRFEAFLLSRENDAFDPRRERYDERTMKRPISEYWINSSHNTYLTGDQLTSASSIDMYSNALYRGCKCLELDVWDGGYDAESMPVPVVWHGHTMTSKILFKDIIKAIKLYLNFHPDSFPILLSFENHCSVPYQDVMAEQLLRILGNSLYVPKEESLLGRLPSPFDLRGMVVIKGRRPLNMDLDDYDVDLSDDEDGLGAPSTAPSSMTNYTNADTSASATPEVHHRVSPALARLTLLHGTKLKGWDVSVMSPTHHMHSFSENKIRSLSKKTDRRKWVIYNQSHMSRGYPAGSRVDSSNYTPCLPWSVGTQMVALNFQTIDAPLLLNDGRFRENGSCGYVLKPSSLMDIQEQLQQQSSGRLMGSNPPLRLSIRILSGSCIPKPDGVRSGDCINPYVKVTVYDVQNGIKESVASFQTSVVYANGFFPIWNGDKMQFVVENPAVAMLQLSVYDKRSGGVLASPTAAMNSNSGDTFVAGATIPISCLRRGLRSVKLFDTSNTRSGAYDFAALLIEVRKNDRSKTGSTPTSASQSVSGFSSSSASFTAPVGPKVPTSPKMMSRSKGSTSSRASGGGGGGDKAEF